MEMELKVEELVTFILSRVSYLTILQKLRNTGIIEELLKNSYTTLEI